VYPKQLQITVNCVRSIRSKVLEEGRKRRATYLFHMLPSCLHWRYLPVKSLQKYSDNFIGNSKVTPFHRPRFEELTLRGKMPFAIPWSGRNFEWALWQEYCQRACHAFDFENVREGRSTVDDSDATSRERERENSKTAL